MITYQLKQHNVLTSTIGGEREWRQQQWNMKVLQLLRLSDFKHNRNIWKEPSGTVLTRVEAYPVYSWIHGINYAHQLTTSSIIVRK